MGERFVYNRVLLEHRLNVKEPPKWAVLLYSYFDSNLNPSTGRILLMG